MKRKKIYIKDIVTTLGGTDYIIIDDGTGKLKGITKTNFSSQIGITIENKIIATEDNIIDFAAASAGYTFDERDMIQLAPDSEGNVLVYIFLGGTKTDVAQYVKVDYSKIDWANILSKPITFNATAPTVTDDSDSGFVVGDLWMARGTTTLYKLTDATVGAAVWENTDSTATKILTDNNGYPSINYQDLNSGVRIGDIGGEINANYIEVKQSAVNFSFYGARFLMPLQTFADNAAAITGGLGTNELYKTATGEVRIVV